MLAWWVDYTSVTLEVFVEVINARFRRNGGHLGGKKKWWRIFTLQDCRLTEKFVTEHNLSIVCLLCTVERTLGDNLTWQRLSILSCISHVRNYGNHVWWCLFSLLSLWTKRLNYLLWVKGTYGCFCSWLIHWCSVLPPNTRHLRS